MTQRTVAYAELQVTTNFSFLRGGSHAQELAFTAAALGLAGLAVTDRNTLAGVVRAWAAAKEVGLPFRVGCRLDFADGKPSVLCYPTDREAYGRLSRLLTLGKTRAESGGCELTWADLYDHAEGQVMMVVPPPTPDEAFERDLTALSGDFRRNVYLAAARPYGARDLKRLHRLAGLARDARAPMVATNDVLYHDPLRRPLQDVLTCIREKTTIHEAGLKLEANAERHLKRPEEMARLFAAYPDALRRTVEVLDRLDFDLGQLKYEYPHEPTPPGRTHDDWLAELSWKGAQWRYPQGIPPKVSALLEKELAFVKAKGLPQYFLTVHDVVRFARDRGILCQGRGSAANSVICYCLGITAVDPTFVDLLFERFLSEERNEPPDIDVDFEHERREEVIQYVYGRYGRDRAAICATVIHYRPRSAIREVGKALGLTEDVTARLADTVWGSWGDSVPDAHVVQAGFDPDNPEISRAVELATELLGFPRHLSQHVGGFILTERPLSETVPIGNAAMEERTFIEWDKDDVEALGLMKVDVLALGMLTALKRGFDMLAADKGVHLPDIASVPKEDPAVYDMLCKADSVGVFQVESRAQMSMLPRLKPRRFYDLVIEVAIVRPGPIQGDMVHPYLRRRDGIDPVEFPSPSPEHGPEDELVQVLGKTLGVPLFQEQAMRMAIEAAKFSPAEANGLRRCMATFKSLGDLSVYRDKFVEGMVRRGYEREFAERCFKQIEGFGSYGFPESHAASFANLVYASSWVKRWHPDVFCAALLNSQPMGFYAPAQLVRDAREHGVEVLGPDVMRSGWDCTLESPFLPLREKVAGGAGRMRGVGAEASEREAGGRQPVQASYRHPSSDALRAPPSPARGEGGLMPVRLGFRQIRGLKREDAERLVAARAAGAASPEAFAAAGVPKKALELLAEADAFRSLGMDRRQALWAVKGLEAPGAPLALAGARAEAQPMLPLMALPEHVVEDYRTTHLSLKAHPVGFFREALKAKGVVPARALRTMKNGRKAAVAGLVLVRQRPGTAKGVTFLTLEDETGAANVVVWRDRFEADRKTVMTASFLLVRGKLQVEGDVIHLVAEAFVDLSPRLRRLRQDGLGDPAAGMKSRDFH